MTNKQEQTSREARILKPAKPADSCSDEELMAAVEKVYLHESRRSRTFVFEDGELKPSDSMTACYMYLKENPDASPEQIWQAATQWADR